MKIDILASGSSGNCVAIKSGDTTILIDAGIPKTKIEKRLLEAGIRPDKIAAIFITHAHKDHVKGLPLANKYRIPVYASEGEWKDIEGVDDELQLVHSKFNGRYIDWTFPPFNIRPVATHHDAYEPVGYVIGTDDGDMCGVVLDTGKVDDEMIQELSSCDTIIIEANHDPSMVEASDYPESVKARILSDLGHLSNQQAANVLGKIIKGMGERIYLTHLSSTNNMPELARMTVEAELRKKGFENGKHYFLEAI